MRQFVLLLAIALLGVTGCARKSSETAYDRTQRAMDDPMGYRPDMQGTDVSGKDTEFDKDGLKKDLDHVLMR
ncbi:MAG TPA: hypothetical protein VFB66_04590 [Tepidisphaeraceae bacterium]|jgi:hypothetical protein|nr:hypothetical protein [Tepidisphaeraceae bacterium]